PAEKAIEPYGFRFRVWTPPVNCSVVVRNLRMLQDFLREDCPPVPEDIKAKVLQVISERPSITMADVINGSTVWRIDHVYTLIASGDIYFDIRNQVLAEPDRAQLFADETTASAFACIQKDLSDAQPRTPSEVRLGIGRSLVWKTRMFKI